MPISDPNPATAKATPATKLPQVAIVIEGNYRVVINRGSENGIRKDQRFVVFGIGETVRDPATGESLGELETVRGVGRVIHVQDRIATIESTETVAGKKITRQTPSDPLYGAYSWLRSYKLTNIETETEPPVVVPFDHPEVGDFARPV
jgi:hypothetical protein